MVRKRTKQFEQTAANEAVLLSLSDGELFDLLVKVCSPARFAQILSAAESSSLHGKEAKAFLVAALRPRERDHCSRLLKSRAATCEDYQFQ